MDGRRCGRLACLNPEGSFVKRGEERRWKRGNEGFQQEKEPKTEACKRVRERRGGRRGGTSTVGVVVYLDTDLKRTLGNLTFS